MRHRITVEKKTIVQDPATGVESESWANKFPTITGGIPASYRPLTSNERQAASARQSVASAEFEIMFGLAIDAGDRVIFDGHVWDIEPPEFDTKQRRLKFKAARGLTNG